MLGAVHLLQAGEALLVDLAVVTLAVVDDRLGELGEHLRWHGRRPRRQQVALLGHLPSLAQECGAPLRAPEQRRRPSYTRSVPSARSVARTTRRSRKFCLACGTPLAAPAAGRRGAEAHHGPLHATSSARRAKAEQHRPGGRPRAARAVLHPPPRRARALRRHGREVHRRRRRRALRRAGRARGRPGASRSRRARRLQGDRRAERSRTSGSTSRSGSASTPARRSSSSAPGRARARGWPPVTS